MGSGKFEILNKGKTLAKNLKVILYQKADSKLTYVDWEARAVCEEKEYGRSYVYHNKIDKLYATDSIPLETNFVFGENVKTVEGEELLFRIYCDEIATPAKSHFYLQIK